MFRVITNSEDVFGMSELKSNVADTLEGLTRQIVRHLIKLYLFPDSDDKNHWRKEVYDFLHNVPTLKPKNRNPKKQFILDSSINCNMHRISVWYKNVYVDYVQNEVPRENASLEEATSIILEYYNWLAEELSRDGEVSRNAVYSQLNSLTL